MRFDPQKNLDAMVLQACSKMSLQESLVAHPGLRLCVSDSPTANASTSTSKEDIFEEEVRKLFAQGEFTFVISLFFSAIFRNFRFSPFAQMFAFCRSANQAETLAKFALPPTGGRRFGGS